MRLGKVMVVFGTRPEAIKMAPVVKELQKVPDIDTQVVVTAQHREMLDQVLELLQIKPDYDLDLMKDKQELYSITTGVLNGLKDILGQEKPDPSLQTTALLNEAYLRLIDVKRVDWHDDRDGFVVACHYAKRSMSAEMFERFRTDPDWTMRPLISPELGGSAG